MSAITQPRMNGREVVRCECGLVQFKSAKGQCVKTPCGKPYIDLGPNTNQKEQYDGRTAEVFESSIAQDHPKQGLFEVGKVFPAILKMLRTANGLSQKGLAGILGTPRTWVSKLERGHVLPTLSSFERLCYALGISMEGFIYLCEKAS